MARDVDLRVPWMCNLSKNKTEITSISINQANFKINQKDFKYLSDYLETKFSKKISLLIIVNFFILIMKKM